MAFFVRLFSKSDGHQFTERHEITMLGDTRGTVSWNAPLDVVATGSCYGLIDFVLECEDDTGKRTGYWRDTLPLTDPNAIIEADDTVNLVENTIVVDLAQSWAV